MRATFITLGLVLAAPVAAQPAPTQPDIVVEGRLEEVLRNFVAALAEPGRSGQLARWDQEICPTVAGIAPAEADYMIARIGEIVRPLHLLVGPAGCRSTALVLISPDADGLAHSLVRNYPVTLGSEGRTRLRRFAESRRPVRWISVSDLCPFGCSLPNSRLTMATHPAFKVMIVIVDARQIGGFSLGEFSDYVALVLLSSPPPGGRPPSASILSMFETSRPAGAQFALTEYDRLFLAGLYESPTNATASQQRAAIVSRMRRTRGRAAASTSD
jgi:hypothetical protein